MRNTVFDKTWFVLFSIFFLGDGFCQNDSYLYQSIQKLTSGQRSREVGTALHKESREWIQSEFQTYGLVKLGNSEKTSYLQHFVEHKQEGANIIGGLGKFDGSESCIILGAHYDGNHNDKNGCEVPGADDNASGVAAMLSIIHDLASQKNKLNRCIIFAAWDFEEAPYFSKFEGIKHYRTLGTNGSRYFTDHPTIPLENISFSITFDLIGGDFFEGAEKLFMILGGENQAAIWDSVNRLKKSLPNRIDGLNFDIRALEPLHNVLGSDDKFAHHRSDYDGFRAKNIPFLFITSGSPWYYHTAFDRIENINFEKLESITNLTRELILDEAVAKKQIEKKYTDLNTDSAESIYILLTQLMSHLSDNLEEPDEKIIRNSKIYAKLNQHKQSIEKSLQSGISPRLDNFYNIYNKILVNILDVTSVRLYKNRKLLQEQNLKCPLKQ